MIHWDASQISQNASHHQDQLTLGNRNIAMESGPFGDVFPIENEIFHCYISLPECI